jgi:hypothetical protein
MLVGQEVPDQRMEIDGVPHAGCILRSCQETQSKELCNDLIRALAEYEMKMLRSCGGKNRESVEISSKTLSFVFVKFLRKEVVKVVRDSVRHESSPTARR